MTVLHSYKDNGSQCFANVRMENGDPVWISVAQTGIVVKKSKIGIFGPKLFVSRDVYHAAQTAEALDEQFNDIIFPANCDMQNPVLKAFVNACLHCQSISQVTATLNEAR